MPPTIGSAKPELEAANFSPCSGGVNGAAGALAAEAAT